ncbi:GOLPH3/VPS74 family protein [Roseivirga sp.]|uniref:GOLPH3/VPS74 family protein n=1 Tax=Roseivirga sp. TaxID=1964215 RepID=UPI003B52F1CD
MKLNLLEEYLLLALDDEKGKFVIDSTRLHYGVAGAILLEFAVRGKIEIDGENVILKDNSYEPEIALNKIIDSIRELKTPSLKKCIQLLTKKSDEIKNDTLQHLINKGILRKEEHKILWIIPTEQYPTSDLTPENKVRKRLDDVISDHTPIDPHDLMLLSLIDATDLTKEAFRDQEDYKAVRKKIKEVTKDIKVSQVINKSIREIQAAIMIAITTSIIVTSVATNN